MNDKIIQLCKQIHRLVCMLENDSYYIYYKVPNSKYLRSILDDQFSFKVGNSNKIKCCIDYDHIRVYDVNKHYDLYYNKDEITIDPVTDNILYGILLEVIEIYNTSFTLM